MIDIQEVSKIKEYQRDFEERFGKRLEIDWDTMKGARTRSITYRYAREEDFIDPEQVLMECVTKYGASLDKIKDRKTRIHAAGNRRERKAVEEFSKAVIESRINVKEAATLINRDRTMIYHFASLS
jgi:hypothetical protein